MPTYNYYCKDCDSHFSYFQKMSESAISQCEKCSGKLKRVITGGTGLIFKGTGFYLTDYNKKPEIKNGEKPLKPEKTGKDKTETKTTDKKKKEKKSNE